MKKKTTEQFIIDARKVHGDKYDYSLVEYKGVFIHIVIICPIHVEFKQTPQTHLRGSGCNACDNEKRLKTTEQFINEAKKIHGDRYDYSLVDYKGAHINVEIICPLHGVFKQTPSSHLTGSGCSVCYNEKRLKTTEQFIIDAKKIHGDRYDYSLVKYNGNKKNIIIICPIHGEFKQTPNRHLCGDNCPKCCTTNIKSTLDEFIKKANLIHNYYFDYSLVDYKGAKINVEIICPLHGVFKQQPNGHLNNQGCPICKKSKGELIIDNYLKENNILYVSQKKFKNCKNKRPLPFDFYLSEYNICIEFDGRQHYEIVNAFGGKDGFNLIKKNDAIKTKYCEDNDIKLIRIPYWEKNNIEEILKKEVI